MCHGSAVGPGVESGSLMCCVGLQLSTGTTTIASFGHARLKQGLVRGAACALNLMCHRPVHGGAS